MVRTTKNTKPTDESVALDAPKKKTAVKKTKLLRTLGQKADNIHQRASASTVNLKVLRNNDPMADFNALSKPLNWDLNELIALKNSTEEEILTATQNQTDVAIDPADEISTYFDKKITLDKKGDKADINIHTNLNRSGHLLDLRPPEKIAQPQKPAPGKPIVEKAPSFLARPQKFSLNPSNKHQEHQEETVKNEKKVFWIPSIERVRIVLTFAIFAFLLVVPVKGYIFYKQINVVKDQLVSISQATAANLQSGVQAATTADWQGALTNFQAAELSLAQAADYLQNTQANLQQVLFGLNPLKSADNLISGATQLTQLAEKFTASIATWSAQEQSANEQLPWAIKQLDEILPEAQAANVSLQQASTFGLPKKYQDQIKELQVFLPYFINQLSGLKDLASALHEVLGYNQEQRYLVVFQNPNEIRATGGFLGSFAQIDVKNGEISKMNIPGGGFYDLQGQATNYTQSPEPMRLIGKDARWMAQDANWYPDWPTSAQKIQWFYEKAGGVSTDGVFAINASLMPKLLKLVGPVTLPQFNITLTADNFITEVQKQVEFNYDKVENKPKQIIAVAAPIILTRLQNLSKDKYPELLATLMTALKQKEVQLYLAKQSLEAQADNWQWTGRITSTTKDYTLAVTQNVGGGKSDAYSQQSLEQDINFSDDGSILKKISINRTQQPAKPDDVFSFTQNNSYIRLYAPITAELLNVTGQMTPASGLFKKPSSDLTLDQDIQKTSGQIITDPSTLTTINKEFGKTVFGNWLTTAPSDSKTINFAYHLPAGYITWQTNRLADWLGALGFKRSEQGTYQLIIQKQSGLNNQKVITRFTWPKNYQVTVAKTPTNAVVNSQAGSLTISYSQTQDEVIILNITKN